MHERFIDALFVKISLTKSIFSRFFCRFPLGPPNLKKRSKSGPNTYFGYIQQVQEFQQNIPHE
jgi:hypothetical protein